MNIFDFRFSIFDLKSKIKNQESKIAFVLCLVSMSPWVYGSIDLLTYRPIDLLIGLPVVSIQYECDGEFSEDEVKSATVVRVGDLYSRSQIRKSIEKIYSLGGFSNVEVKAQPSDLPPGNAASTSVMLTFILTKQINTGDIYLTGNDKLKIEEIIQVMRLKKGQEYDDSIAKMDIQAIKELYKSQGYFDAGISFNSIVDNSAKQADVYFSITEEEQPIVKEIVFIGTNQAVIRTKVLFHIGLEFQDDLDSISISPALLQEFESKGVSLSSKAAISEKSGQRWLITDVGKVYSVRKEDDRLNVYETKNLLEAMQEVKLGEVYKGQRALNSDAKLIEETHRQEGYITAKVNKAQAFVSDQKIAEEYREVGTHFSINPSNVNHRVRGGLTSNVTIVIEVEQGRRVYIKIEGDKDIKDDDIKKAIAVGRMRSVSESVLRKSDEDIENLYKLKGYYLADVKHKVLKDEVWDFVSGNRDQGIVIREQGSEISHQGNPPTLLTVPYSLTPKDYFLIPDVEIDTDIYQKVIIRMKTNKGSAGRLYWTDKPGKWDRKKYQDFSLVSDDLFRDYEIDLRNHRNWSGKVVRFRLRPVDVPDADTDIASIKVTTESIPVIFTVDKKRLMRVQKVTINGVQGAKLEVPEEEIKKQMLTRKRSSLAFWPIKRYFPDGTFYEPIFDMDLRAITAFYKDQGYPNARIVGYNIVPNEENGEIGITITIYEGSRTVITEVILEGNHKDILDSKEILSNLAVVPSFQEQDLTIESLDPPRSRYKIIPHTGELPNVFRDDDIVADRSYLRSRYADEGYLAQIDPIKKFIPAYAGINQTEVAITYRIVEGKRIRIHDKIEITGNTRTKRHVIERELSDRLTKDKIFSYAEIAKSWQNLLDLGLFERVRIDTRPIDGSEDLYKMTVDVAEKDAISVNLHAGFSSASDFRGGIEATHINLWGTGRRVNGKYRIGIEGSSYGFNYAEPRLLGTSALGLADVYRYSERDYNETRTGGTVGISQRLYRINTLTYRYRYDFVEYEIDEDERTARIGSIETTFERDGRDNPLNPKRGWFNSLTLQYANPLLSGEETFAKFTANGINYSRLPWNSVLAIGGRAGYAWGLGGTELVLIPEQFQMRDYMTPRGYKWDEKDTGSLMLNLSMEIRFPIYKWIGGGIFFDSGHVDEPSHFRIQSMRSSVGLGLRLNTPIGPLRLDYGYPLRGDGKRNYWPHVGFGHAF